MKRNVFIAFKNNGGQDQKEYVFLSERENEDDEAQVPEVVVCAPAEA